MSGRSRSGVTAVARSSSRPRPILLRLSLACAVFVGACSDAGPETELVIESPGSTEVVVGESLALTVTASGEVGRVSWASSDPYVAVVSAGAVEALRPGTTVVTASASGAGSDEITITVVARPDGYAAEEIDYFTEIAFGAEFEDPTPLLRRWRVGSGPLIRINGSPNAEDLEVVDSVVAEINRLAPVAIELVAESPTAEMHFVPESEFDDILPQAPSGNVGLVWLYWDASQHLIQSVVLIATDIEQGHRNHIIREELTQMLGLLRDSHRYPESIFYQPFSLVTGYLPIDRAVIDLLYRPELEVGMTASEAARAARLLIRTTPETMVAERGARAGWWGAPSGDTSDQWTAGAPGPLRRGEPGSAGSGAGRPGPGEP